MWKASNGRILETRFYDWILEVSYIQGSTNKKTNSPARFLEAGNLNILSLPGASIRHLYDYIPPAGRFEIIILFIGGNDLFDGFEPSSKTPQKVAQDLIELADFACQRTRSSVFVLGIPERDKNRE